MVGCGSGCRVSPSLWTTLVVVCISLTQPVESGFYHKTFHSTRGWKFFGSAGKSKNNTIELISEKPLLGEKTWEICSIWSKRKVYWHEGFEMRLVFRMRVPDTTNNGGEGFALVWQQERPNFMGDLRNKGGRPNGQTYYPAGLGINALTRSFAIKFDNSPQTTDPSNKPHFSIHEAGDWVNPYPSSAFTDQIPAYNNGHDHILKIYYDIEDVPGEGRVGFMSFYWISEFEGENTWGTLDKPIFKTRVHFDALKKEPAWIGFTSTSSETRVQTTDIVAWTYHETRSINNDGQKCIVCGGINMRCCLENEQMKREKDASNPPSYVYGNTYIGQDPNGILSEQKNPPHEKGTIVNKPRLWQYQVWDVPNFQSALTGATT